jgi:hypothetical protein
MIASPCAKADSDDTKGRGSQPYGDTRDDRMLGRANIITDQATTGVTTSALRPTLLCSYMAHLTT